MAEEKAGHPIITLETKFLISVQLEASRPWGNLPSGSRKKDIIEAGEEREVRSFTNYTCPTLILPPLTTSPLQLISPILTLLSLHPSFSSPPLLRLFLNVY